MIRKSLLALGSLTAIGSVYVILTGLEIRWNLFAWEPRIDALAIGILAALLTALATCFVLARVSRDRVCLALSLLAGLALLAPGLQTHSTEPLTTGLFARDEASPLWYRGGRLFVTALPLSFWVWSGLRRKTEATAAP